MARIRGVACEGVARSVGETRQVFRLPRGYFRIRWRPLEGPSVAASSWLSGDLADWRLARARPAMLGGVSGYIIHHKIGTLLQ